MQLGDALTEVVEDLPGSVAAAVVDDDNLVRHVVEVELKVKVFDGGADAAFFIACGHDDGEQ
jgi:hypothetical protein